MSGLSAEWEMTRLGDVLIFQVGFPFESRYFLSSPAGPRLVRNRDLRADDAVVYYLGDYSTEYLIEPGDVLVGMDGDFSPYVWRQGRALLNQRVGRIRVTNRASQRYLAYAIAGPLKDLEGATGATTVKHLSHRDVESITIPLPSRVEQERIAVALEDCDAFISALEREITKKQAIRQGMMQQLLTGRTRLPSFTAPWQEVTIGDLASVSGGGTPSTRVSSLWGGGIPWFTPAEIPESGAGVVTSSDRTITEAGLQKSAAKLLPEGTVLVTSRASIGNCAIAGCPVATNQGFTSLVPKDRESTEFLYYWVQQHRARFVSRAAGSTFLEISGSKVAAIEVLAPGADEQSAIGTVLKDADAELRALQQGLTKARDVKQGMMQELLTGRTRMPIEESPQ